MAMASGDSIRGLMELPLGLLLEVHEALKEILEARKR